MREDFHHYLYGQRVKDDSVKYHFKGIDPEEVTLDKPAVFVFGGTGTYGDRSVNGYLKAIESLLGEFSYDADMIGLDYNFDHDVQTNYNNAEVFVNSILYPHLQINGKKIDVDLVCRKMRQITIFAHCFGKKFTDTLIDCLETTLKNLGYTEDECEKIVKQIFVISYAAPKGTTRAKSLNVVSPIDSNINESDYAWKFILRNDLLEQISMSPSDRKEIERLKDYYGKLSRFKIGQFYQKNERVFVVKDSAEESIYLATSCPFDAYWWDHDVMFIPRDKDYKALERATKVGDYVSRCLLSALCNSVANSILNSRSDKLIPFDLEELKLQLEEVVKELNSKETVPYDNELI